MKRSDFQKMILEGAQKMADESVPTRSDLLKLRHEILCESKNLEKRIEKLVKEADKDAPIESYMDLEVLYEHVAKLRAIVAFVEKVK